MVYYYDSWALCRFRPEGKIVKLRRRDVLKASGYAAAGSLAARFGARPALAGQDSSLACDVCVIGGGSAGTYAAVRLRDLGKTVVLIERAGRLGGHANTYYANGVPIDIGVRYFEDIPLVQQYFTRLNVSAVQTFPGATPTTYVDFQNGQVAAGYTPPPPAQLAIALYKYQEILTTQFPYLDSGFQLPNPVPQDLLNPFSDFVTKYGLADLVFSVIFEYGQGLGNLLADPALYVLKNFSLGVVNSLVSADFLAIPAGTQQLYDNAAALLGDAVIFYADVKHVNRSGSQIQVLADTPDGLVGVQCGQLVIACPPTLQNLAPLDLDQLELSTFSKLRSKCYVTALVQLSGLPDGQSLVNTGTATEYNLPPLPALYLFDPTDAPGLWNVLFGADAPVPNAIVGQTIQETIRRIAAAGTYPVQLLGCDLYRNHTPFEMMVSPEDIAGGYYNVLNSLQGRHNTFYTGAAFQTNDSTLIWQFTEALLPSITA
jgi:Flavin containing amine oxidoreductase